MKNTLLITISTFCILIIIACRPNEARNPDGIVSGDCVEYKINSEIQGIVITTGRSTISVRLENGTTTRFWKYGEVKRIDCPND